MLALMERNSKTEFVDDAGNHVMPKVEGEEDSLPYLRFIGKVPKRKTE